MSTASEGSPPAAAATELLPRPDPNATTQPVGPACASLSERCAIPGYELLGEIGRGGMGVVYKARQSGFNRVVALKMILAGEHAGPDDLARFKAEAEAIARLHHPNIVQVYGIGEHQGPPFFSLEFCGGRPLAPKLPRTSPPPPHPPPPSAPPPPT